MCVCVTQEGTLLQDVQEVGVNTFVKLHSFPVQTIVAPASRMAATFGPFSLLPSFARGSHPAGAEEASQPLGSRDLPPDAREPATSRGLAGQRGNAGTLCCFDALTMDGDCLVLTIGCVETRVDKNKVGRQ